MKWTIDAVRVHRYRDGLFIWETEGGEFFDGERDSKRWGFYSILEKGGA